MIFNPNSKSDTSRGGAHSANASCVMSFLGKKWHLKNNDLQAFLSENLDNETVTFHDPFLMKGMATAVKRLEQAIGKGERILIFGDYDVDGVSGTAILVHVLRELGAQVSYRLPDRQSGYGLNTEWVKTFQALDVSLLITVDCGISSRVEIEALVDQGMDVIVTDHHAIPTQIPEKALAILHPQIDEGNYPFPYLSGSGVAFKLAVALVSTLKGDKEAKIALTRFADLAALGTVADCVPLTGENRWIVKQGLDQLQKTDWIGLKKLLENAGVDPTQAKSYDTDLIGFRIGPRLNAAGRMDTPYFALQLLLNENDRADEFVQKLEEMNRDRQSQLLEIEKEAEQKMRENGEEKEKIFILGDPGWPAGIIGLIAARLGEKYHRPTIILEHRGDECVASCRSPEYFDIGKALQSMGHHFKTYGGHAGAAGFTIVKDQLEAFIKDMRQYAQEIIQDESLESVLPIDFEVEIGDVTFDLVEQLLKRAPFGQGNEKPRFVVRGVMLHNMSTVGREKKHLKFYVRTSGDSLSAIAFKFGEHYPKINALLDQKSTLDLVFELDRSIWNGEERLELKVVDIQTRTK